MESFYIKKWFFGTFFLLIWIPIIAKNVATTCKKSLIFGVTGQDGTYLSEFLLEKGYEVHGVKRRSSLSNTARIDPLIALYSSQKDPLYNRFFLHYGDITDSSSVTALIQKIQPDEIYNLAAQSHVRISFDIPEYTTQVDALGTLRILEAIRLLDLKDKTRFYQASTSEMFGKVLETPQTENTPFYPRSPYGVAKVYGFWITKNYREAYNIYACNGILFNHESPIRGEDFVTKKITNAVVKIKLGKKHALYLGNLNASRDWGHAHDYVKAMWLMLQQDQADDFVIATGHTHTVREFVELAFNIVGIEIAWRGQGLNEVGYDKATGKELIFIDPSFFRPTEVDLLLGDASKAQRLLEWQPIITFEELVKEMIKAEFKLLAQ